MDMRAAVYVRVSTTAQASEDRTSPEDQEHECREYTQTHGYRVVGVYTDTQRYRGSDGKMREPSGEHSDRPGFRRMLADIDAGLVDIVIAWDQERLYRGISVAAIELRDRIKDGIVAIEVVRGVFDSHTMEVIAWAKGLEVEARRVQALRGLKSRLRQGRVVQMGSAIYGYNFIDGELTINEVEAQVVRKIWAWSAEGISRAEMRRRLIAEDAPQANTTTANKTRRHAWSFRAIDRIRYRDTYHTGVLITRVGKGKKARRANGGEQETYETHIPIIVDKATAKACKARQAAWKAYPTGRLKTKALFAGRIRCAVCGHAMILNVTRRTKKDGTQAEWGYYICSAHRRGEHSVGCPGRVILKTIDGDAWDRIHELLAIPGNLEGAIQVRVKDLQSHENTATENIRQIEEALERLFVERQRVLHHMRKGTISEEDLEALMTQIAAEQTTLERERDEMRLLIGNQGDELMRLAALFREQVQEGLKHIDKDSAFHTRRRIVESIGATVIVHSDGSFEVHTLIDFAQELRGVMTTHPPAGPGAA